MATNYWQDEEEIDTLAKEAPIRWRKNLVGKFDAIFFIIVLSFLMIPTKVLRILNSLQRNFMCVCGGVGEEKKVAWVMWDVVC